MRPRTVALVTTITLAACLGAEPPAAPSPTVADDAPPALADIQSVVDGAVDAANRQDLVAFQSTFDRTRTALWLCAKSNFEILGRLQARFRAMRVARVEPYGTGYFRAFVGQTGTYSIQYFRKQDGRWVRSEPRLDELGASRTKVIADVELSYWAILDDVADGIAHDTASIREDVARLAPSPMRTSFVLALYPTAESASAGGCNVTARMNPRASPPAIDLYSFTVDDSYARLSATSQGVLRHEGLHWVQEQVLPGTFEKADWFLIEGWPDYMAQIDRRQTFRQAACGIASLPTFAQLASGAGLDSNRDPETTSRYYAFANIAVEYLVTALGSATYWKLLEAEHSAGKANDADTYPQVLGQAPDAFRDAWAKWATQKYC